MPDLTAAVTELKYHLGDFLERDRPDGLFVVQVGGPGSVAELADLDVPELHLDLLPEEPGEAQVRALRQLGYWEDGKNWQHPGGWRLVFPDHGTGWRADQQALRQLLLADAGARDTYREVYQREGREAADKALHEAASAHHARTVGFVPAQFVAERLSGLTLPWMFAAGFALDLHLGRVTRAHDDLDVVVPREAQQQIRAALSNWRLDACVDGTYRAWTVPLKPPYHQVHARHPELPDVLMLDLMFSDFSDGLWHYRRDPSITLPLSEARRIGPQGLPYLAPHAALLFKSATGGGSPRLKDQQDFLRVLPTLSAHEREWLQTALRKANPQHSWLGQL